MLTFKSHYTVTDINIEYKKEYSFKAEEFLKNYNHIGNLIKAYAGNSIENGFFRIHNYGSSYFWTHIISEYFKSNNHGLYCFGFDFYGRQYTSNMKDDEINMLDPSDGGIYILDMTLSKFFNEFLIEGKEEPFGYSDFKSVKSLYEDSLAFNNCLGFKKLLFLGGEDELDNLEVSDMEVYWELNRQLKEQSQ